QCVITLVRMLPPTSETDDASRSRASSRSISANVAFAPLQPTRATAIVSGALRASGCTTALVAPPRSAVAVHELVRGRRAPRAGGVVREGRPVALPGGHDRVHERPLLLDLVRAREERRVADHRVEDQ